VIIIAYALMDEEEIKRHRPRIAIMGDQNEILEVIGEEVHGTAL